MIEVLVPTKGKPAFARNGVPHYHIVNHGSGFILLPRRPMTAYRYSLRISLVALAVLGASLAGAEKTDEAKVELRVAKYDDMGQAVLDLKGKIVVVDFWQDT
jgi:hypothetical protein